MIYYVATILGKDRLKRSNMSESANLSSTFFSFFELQKYLSSQLIPRYDFISQPCDRRLGQFALINLVCHFFRTKAPVSLFGGPLDLLLVVIISEFHYESYSLGNKATNVFCGLYWCAPVAPLVTWLRTLAVI